MVAARIRRALWYYACRLAWFWKLVPKRLCERGRRPDQIFRPEEKLYRRVSKMHFLQNGQLDPGKVSFPDISVNREKYSKPSDVIFADGLSKSRQLYLWGVVYCVSKTLPAPIKDGRGEEYQFAVDHEPLENNYSHSELSAYKDNERQNKVSGAVKKLYRVRLASQLQLKIKPLV